MIYGLYLSAAGLQANAYQQDLIANNLANADTTGFKHELAVVSERRVEVDEGGRLRNRHRLLDGLSGGSQVAPTYTTFEQGPLRETNRPLDLAIAGDGFFQVRDGDQVRYTRDGRFTTDTRGQLITVTGKPVLDDGQREIFVDPDSGEPITVSPGGRINQGPEPVGRIELVDFPDKQALTKAGQGLFNAHGQAPVAAAGELKSGFLEMSTVDPVTGLARMIQVHRAYQLNATMISLQDGMLSRAVNDVGRVG